jgi:hypothetical protein
MEFITALLQVLLGYNLVLPVVCYLCYLLFGKKTKPVATGASNYDYAIIVTAYEQTTLLPAVVTSLLKLNYEHYLIYVVLDNCGPEDIGIDHPNVIQLRPEQVLASNTRSHFYAIDHFKRDHENFNDH